ncbi:MAG: crossover junction endodeoxyribonuclease RuvC [Desulfobacterales bacterium]|nr:MAG: crossover junction endodeoxyribonuclease RuvC [Desulfobacterales bacterium]
MVKIVGVDPGLAATGVGIVRGWGLRIDSFSFGSINTSPNTALPSRLNQIFSKLLHLLKTESPHLMVVEDVFSLKKYPKSGIVLGQVTGVVLLAGSQAAVPILEIPVREAKQILTGNGNASKQQLEKAVRSQLNLPKPIRPYHAADAMGLALIGLFRRRERL